MVRVAYYVGFVSLSKLFVCMYSTGFYFFGTSVLAKFIIFVWPKKWSLRSFLSTMEICKKLFLRHTFSKGESGVKENAALFGVVNCKIIKSGMLSHPKIGVELVIGVKGGKRIKLYRKKSAKAARLLQELGWKAPEKIHLYKIFFKINKFLFHIEHPFIKQPNW